MCVCEPCWLCAKLNQFFASCFLYNFLRRLSAPIPALCPLFFNCAALRFHFVCLFIHKKKNQSVYTLLHVCVAALLYESVCVGCAYFAALCASSEWKPERAARRMRFQSAVLSRCLPSVSLSVCLSRSMPLFMRAVGFPICKQTHFPPPLLGLFQARLFWMHVN